MRPTLEQLLPLARVHGAPLDELVGAPATGDPRVHLRPVRRGGLTFVPLTRRRGGIHDFKVIYPAVGRAYRSRLQTHEGHEWFYVLDGRVRFVLGDQDLVLGPGEAAEFDARQPHWLLEGQTQPVLPGPSSVATGTAQPTGACVARASTSRSSPGTAGGLCADSHRSANCMPVDWWESVAPTSGTPDLVHYTHSLRSGRRSGGCRRSVVRVAPVQEEVEVGEAGGHQHREAVR